MRKFFGLCSAASLLVFGAMCVLWRATRPRPGPARAWRFGGNGPRRRHLPPTAAGTGAAQERETERGPRQPGPASGAARRYRAFISYSHKADGQLAPAVEAALRRFALPWYLPRGRRLFRDTSTLAMTPALWPAIQAALDESDNFVLMASPPAGCSQWVRSEVDYWLGLCRRDPGRAPPLIVWTDGALRWDSGDQRAGRPADFDWRATDALPPELRKAYGDEPLYVDLRWATRGEKATLRDPRFRQAIAQLTAAIERKALDEIIGADIKRRRVLTATVTAVTLVLGLVSAAAVYGKWESDRQRGLAEATLADAIGVANLITREVDVRLQDLAGAESAREAILKSAYSMLDGLAKRPARSEKIELAKADIANNIGSWEFRHSELHRAKTLFLQSLNILAELQDQSKPVPPGTLANVRINLGRVCRDLRQFEEAMGFYQAALDIVRQGSGHPELDRMAARAYYGIGDVKFDESDLPAALDYYQQAERFQRTLVEESRRNSPELPTELLDELSATLDRLGLVSLQLKLTDKASAYQEEAYKLRIELVGRDGNNAQFRRDLSVAAARLGTAELDRKRVKQAQAYFVEAAKTLEVLVSLAPASKTHRYDWAIALTDLADAETMDGAFREAESHYLQSLSELNKVLQLDSNNPTVVGQKVVTVNSLAEMFKQAGDKVQAAEKYQEAVTVVDDAIYRWPQAPSQFLAKATILLNLAEVEKVDRPDVARSYLVTAEQILVEAIPIAPDDPRFSSLLKEIRGSLKEP
jgi:tetratricopeptide (TPR) repeat protein